MFQKLLRVSAFAHAHTTVRLSGYFALSPLSIVFSAPHHAPQPSPVVPALPPVDTLALLLLLFTF